MRNRINNWVKTNLKVPIEFKNNKVRRMTVYFNTNTRNFAYYKYDCGYRLVYEEHIFPKDKVIEWKGNTRIVLFEKTNPQ